ncbi:MAG TPA: hypothetical protein VF516_15150 [Kofleriaceae bacterium]
MYRRPAASPAILRYTTCMSTQRNVLVIGFDPHAFPEYDARPIVAAIAVGMQRFEAEGIPAELCLVQPDATAEPEIVARLTARDWACVVIGGGIRKHDPVIELFERVIHLVRQHAPGAAIAFNTNPTDCLDAALRWLR